MTSKGDQRLMPLTTIKVSFKFNAREIRVAMDTFKLRPTLNRDQGYEIKPVLLQLLAPRDGAPHGSGGPTLQVGTRNRANSM